jgi:capping protein alpha
LAFRATHSFFRFHTMASQQEINKIVTQFLLNAPPGEFMEVVTDIRGLLKNDSILNQLAPSTFRQYNTDQMIKVKTPKGEEVLITKYGEISPNEYLDPTNKQIIIFDHIRQEVTGTRPAGSAMDSDVESFRKAFDQQTQEYVKDHYPSGCAAVYGSKDGHGQFVVTICISSALFNPNNFYNGRWRSVWTCSFRPGGGAAELKGTLRINVHYYEDGNVQLNTNTSKSKQVSGSDPNSLAAAALKTIAAIEGDFHNALDTSYRTMGETTFKALRRHLPITRKKLEWNKIMQYKIGAELNK